MKKLLIFMNIFWCGFVFGDGSQIDQPEEILIVKEGAENDKVRISTRGGDSYPKHFVVNSKGEIFIEDIASNFESGILHFDSTAAFKERISLKGFSGYGLRKMGMDVKDTLYYSNGRFLVQYKNGISENLIVQEGIRDNPGMPIFYIFNDLIVYENKEYDYNFVGNQLSIHDYKKREIGNHGEEFSEELKNTILNTKMLLLLSNGSIVSSDITKLYKLFSDEQMLEKYEIDYQPFDFAKENKSYYDIYYMGTDIDGNSYWNQYNESNSTVVAYNRYGKELVSFETISVGDISTYFFRPTIDKWGNIYVMPVYKEQGCVKIFKYTRTW